MYGFAILMGCGISVTANGSYVHVPHVGQSNETSWYFSYTVSHEVSSISVTLTDSPPCPLTPSWSASVTPPPTYQTALIGPITFKHIQD